jgi:heterodisulfide reductase subunit C
VDCAAIMDALREVSLLQDKVNPQAQQIVTFQRAFLDNIRRNGRLNELDLIARFKSTVALRTREFSFLFKDASLAPQLRRLKKLHLSQPRSKDLSVVDRIFARCTEIEK